MSDPIPVYECIVAGLLAALGSVELNANAVRIERGRTEPVTEADCPILLLQEEGETTAAIWTGADSHLRNLVIEGAVVVAPAPGTDSAEVRRRDAQAKADGTAALLKALVRQVLGRLDAMPDALDGLVDQIAVIGEGPPQRLTVQTDNPACAFSLNVSLAYATAEGDPFTAA